MEISVSEQLLNMHVPLRTLPDGAVTFRLDYKTGNPDEVCNCPMLDSSKGCMLPRELRPFECRVWPIRVMRDVDGSLVIACYKYCTALLPDVRAKLHAYATGELLSVLLHFAQENPKSVRMLDETYHIIWRETKGQ